MATLAELARNKTTLDSGAIEHLERLVGSWALLSDLSFSDLLLIVAGRGDGRFVVVGQVRPSTSQTLHREDLVGRPIEEADLPLVARAWRLGEIVEGEVVTSHGDPARVQCIPVRCAGELVAVLARQSPVSLMRRQPGELERVYLSVFERFAHMVVRGEFPFTEDDLETEESPRVGDGALLVDKTGRIEYTSPNAVNALHRIGINSTTEGMRLDELGVEEDAVMRAFATGTPVTEEIIQPTDVIVLLRCVPLLEHGTVNGALVLLRDVSDLRRRDRLILSKDATIREIHHRVKNNLQTVSALLRLQARRVAEAHARIALEEAERRVRSIARVHDVLSREVGEQVSFEEIVPELLRMGEETVQALGRPVRFCEQGDPGELPAQIATPLALVLTELLQNAGEHGFLEEEGEEGEGRVTVAFLNSGDRLEVRVMDNGVGLPADFSIDGTRSLGLSIVRDLVTSQLGGTMRMSTPDGRGTLVELEIPLVTDR